MSNRSLSLSKGLGAGQFAVVQSFIASETIVAKTWVDLDVSKTGEDRTRYIVEGNATAHCVGVALEGGSAGDVVQVCTYGYVEGALTDGGVFHILLNRLLI
jgi:hypothetical protein